LEVGGTAGLETCGTVAYPEHRAVNKTVASGDVAFGLWPKLSSQRLDATTQSGSTATTLLKPLYWRFRRPSFFLNRSRMLLMNEKRQA
jgi:hypothetical protein